MLNFNVAKVKLECRCSLHLNSTGCDKFLTNMELFTPNPPSTTVNYEIKLSITPNLYARVACLF